MVLVMSLCSDLTLQNTAVLGRGFSPRSAFLFELVSLTIDVFFSPESRYIVLHDNTEDVIYL